MTRVVALEVVRPVKVLTPKTRLRSTTAVYPPTPKHHAIESPMAYKHPYQLKLSFAEMPRRKTVLVITHFFNALWFGRRQIKVVY